MRKNSVYTFASLACLTFILCGILLTNRSSDVTELPFPNLPNVAKEEIAAFTAAVLSLAAPKTTALAHKPDQHVKKTMKRINRLNLNKISFQDLPGWDKADVKKSFQAFQVSCKTFLKQEPNSKVGSSHIHMQAKDWHASCLASLQVNVASEQDVRYFFEKWFHPIEFEQKKPVKGVFTGYYMPKMPGSLSKTPIFTTPIYGLPETSHRHGAKQFHYTRAEIDEGALKKKAPIIAWIKSPVDRLFMEIEGAGVIQLRNGNLYLGYAGENGAPYTSISQILIRKKIFTKDNASKSAIKSYLESHPQIRDSVLHQNKSFVFFERLKQTTALGAEGMPLTPGYSLAIDRKWIPLGAPLWLATTKPDKRTDNEHAFKRLMIAQDTGGAIRGAMRGDVYWGSGKNASFLGENMKTLGQYWLLLPKTISRQQMG